MFYGFTWKKQILLQEMVAWPTERLPFCMSEDDRKIKENSNLL